MTQTELAAPWKMPVKELMLLMLKCRDIFDELGTVARRNSASIFALAEVLVFSQLADFFSSSR